MSVSNWALGRADHNPPVFPSGLLYTFSSPTAREVKGLRGACHSFYDHQGRLFRALHQRLLHKYCPHSGRHAVGLALIIGQRHDFPFPPLLPQQRFPAGLVPARTSTRNSFSSSSTSRRFPSVSVTYNRLSADTRFLEIFHQLLRQITSPRPSIHGIIRADLLGGESPLLGFPRSGLSAAAPDPSSPE